MTCAACRELLSAALDGEARPREAGAAARHLAVCAHCRQDRAAAEALRDGLRRAAWRSPDDDRRDEEVLDCLRREALEARGWRPGLRSSFWPAAAAMAASFLLTWGALRWAERNPLSHAPVSAPAATAHAVGPRSPAMLEEWLQGPPTVAALSRLQRLPLSPPGSGRTPRRSAVPRSRRTLG
jgi:anti-sigma factor RsiW